MLPATEPLLCNRPYRDATLTAKEEVRPMPPKAAEKFRSAACDFNIEADLLQVFNARNAILTSLSLSLDDARAEAIEEDLPPLTDSAREACTAAAQVVVRDAFYRDGFKIAATAKLNGGATLVIANELKGRRVDLEFPPDGSSPTVLSSDERGRVRVLGAWPRRKLLGDWVDWLFAKTKTIL